MTKESKKPKVGYLTDYDPKGNAATREIIFLQQERKGRIYLQVFVDFILRK